MPPLAVPAAKALVLSHHSGALLLYTAREKDSTFAFESSIPVLAPQSHD